MIYFHLLHCEKILFLNTKKSAVWISTTNDETRGQSVADFRRTAEQTRFDNRPVQRIAVNFRYQAFKREFMSTMLKPDCS